MPSKVLIHVPCGSARRRLADRSRAHHLDCQDDLAQRRSEAHLDGIPVGDAIGAQRDNAQAQSADEMRNKRGDDERAAHLLLEEFLALGGDFLCVRVLIRLI